MDKNFRELLKKEYVVFDGAMGTMLQAAGMKMGETPEVLSITQPQLLVGIHEKYLRAGADVIYANTFGANRYKLEECGKSVDEIVKASIKNAKQACENVNPQALVALDVGPIGQLLEPTGTLSFEEAYDMYREIVEAGSAAGADLVVFETMTDLLECKAAVLAAKEHSDLPVAVTMTFEINQRTFTGCCIEAMALTLSGLGVDALGVNCSLGPAELEPVVAKLSEWTNLPVIVKPNAGLPDPVTNEYNVSPEEFAQMMKNLRKYGIKVFGGCCGTTPDFIRCVSEMLHTDGNAGFWHEKEIPAAVCSPTKAVTITEPRIIGERINPTGKKLFKEALLRGDMDALPMAEETGLPFASQNGCMHACGHDMHASMMLGAAKILCGMRERFAGCVKLIFQHSEDTLPGGAKELVEKGVLENPHVDAIYGMHVLPDAHRAGQVGFHIGPITTSVDLFDFTVSGRGGHGSQPQNTTDPVLAAAQMIVMMQQIVARRVDPMEMAVFSLGSIHGGDAPNVIPAEVKFGGVTRAYSESVRSVIKEQVQAIAKGIEAASGNTVHIHYADGYPSAFNDKELMDLAADAVRKELGEDAVVPMPDPMPFSEDFSFYGKLGGIPSAYLMLSAGHEGELAPLHNPKCAVREDVMPAGIRTLVSIALEFLK